MAIRKLPSGAYKPLVRGTDGRWLPLGSFPTRAEAEAAKRRAQDQLASGGNVTADSARLTLDQFFKQWFEGGTSKASPGWRNDQVEMYIRYVQPLIGAKRLKAIKPVDIAAVMKNAESMGRAPQTRTHIFSLLHKMFRDAVEMFELLDRNPVKRDLKPVIPEKEAPHLKVEQAAKLLQYVRGKEFELAVWLNVYIGMRVGEIQALKWECLDLDRGIVHIRATFVRKEHRIKDYPKGKRWHSVQAPPELLELLRKAKATSEFVVPSPRRAMMSYNSYYKALQRYCKEAGVPEVATHGLRHSTAAIYRAHGATRDDIYHLFKHSSPSVTARYIHDDTERVGEVAKVVRLFPLAGAS